MWLSALDSSNINILHYFILAKVDLNFMVDNKFSVLSKAVKSTNYSFCLTLLRNGADVNISNESGKTALYIAIERGNLRITELLIRYGADYNK